ncbi:uncharacterized protein LOC106060266 isoform X2 [Biomphalaria glabrata]|uniref:Uncharacterized protein LOC106060266 isoform X2 n=1 Tax=Biomphalaria glabrata TaxID=6526 RepID=A0A9W2ZWL3_BIOGL|nr:uncharacterized protein LOC106060266 isoform X2 [Biomphalaria glabrata]
MDEDSDVDKDLDSSLLADLHHGLDSSVDDCSSVFDKEEFMALKGAQKVEENQTEGLAMDQIAMLQEMVQEMKKGFQSAVEELGKIQAKEEHDSARGKQQQQLENLTETLQEIKSQLSVLTKDVDLIKDEQKLIKEQLEEVRSNRGSSLDRRSQSDSESHQVIPIPDSELLPEEWNYKISDFPAVEDAKQTLDTSDEARTSNDSEVTSVACKSLSLTQALAEKCLRLNHMESSDEEERSTNRRVSHYTPKLSHLLLQEAANRRHSMPVVPTPENTTRDVVNAGKRQKTVKDLADSERDYCSKLWSLLNNYLTPLQSGGFFSAKELDVLIPQYMEQLYVEHCHICTGLQERLVHWTHMGTIADLFTRVTDLNSLDSILPFYQVYAEDLPTAITCLKRALLQSSEFKDFLRAIKHSSCASEDLMALIMSPVQHMPRFLLQLQQILRYTPTTHLDYPLLQTSLQRLRTFVDQLNKDVSSAMQVLSQENSLRLNGNEFQGSQLDTSLHLVTSEEDNITSARALSKSTLSHVQSEWLDDVYSHRSLQQFEDTRHHMMRPLSGHTNTLSQPDLTNINGYPQEMSGLAHFPRSQSSIPSTAVNEGLGERQYRHYKSPRARPSSAIDFIGHGPQQYHYNHLTKRLYPGPLPRPHSAMGPMGMPVIDGQHRPTIISRKHLRRSQPLAGSKSFWPETSSSNISPLAYPKMKEDDDDDDDEDDTRTSDTHSLVTTGSHPPSSSHCSNESPETEFNHTNIVQESQPLAQNLDHKNSVEFSAAEVTASLAKKLYPGQVRIHPVGQQNEKLPSDLQFSREEVSPKSHPPGNPFRDYLTSSVLDRSGVRTVTNGAVMSTIVPNVSASQMNNNGNSSPNPFKESRLKSQLDDRRTTLPVDVNSVLSTEDNNDAHSGLQNGLDKGEEKQSEDKQLSEKNKQFLLSLAHTSTSDPHNKHSLRLRGVTETNKSTNPESIKQPGSSTETKSVHPQPPPRFSRNVGLESTFTNGSVETNYVGLAKQTDFKTQKAEVAPNGHTLSVNCSTNDTEGRTTMASVENSPVLTLEYHKSNSNDTAAPTHQSYTSPLDPFTQSSVSFFTANIQPVVRPTNPFLATSRNSFNPAASESTSSGKDDGFPATLSHKDSNFQTESHTVINRTDSVDDVRKKEDRMRAKDGGRLSLTHDMSRTIDDPVASRKKMHFKASIKNLFSKKKGSIILADVEREVVMEMACAAVSTMSRSDIPSGITNQKADNFKSTESIEGKWNKEEMAFEIKTRKDQGSSTSSPIKVSKLFHSQPKVAKILSRAGKDCCELSKDEFQQFQTSLDSARPQEPSPNNSAVCTPYTVSSQAMKGNVADRNTVQFQDVIEKQIMSQTTEVALLNKDKTLFPSDQSYSDGTIINMNKFLPPKTGQVKEISGRVKGKMRDSKSQTGESDTLLIRKFEKDQQHTASELDSRKSEKQAFKTSIFLCHKCQIGDNEQNKCTSGSGIVLSNSSNISEKHVIEKCKVCGSYWQNKDSPQTDANREYNGVDAKMNIDVPHTASEDLSCAECLKPCSNAIQSYEQSLSSQLKACQDLERQILDSEKCFKLSPSQSTSFVSKSLISSHSQHQGKGDTGIEGILNTRHEKNDHISSNNFIRIDKHDQVASNKSQKSNSGDHISNINSTKSDKNDNISGNNSSRNDTLDLVSGNNSSKSSENKITKSFFKLFLPSKSDSNSKSPKSDSNSKSLKSDSNSKSNSYGSNQVAEDPTLKTSKTSVSSAVTAPLSNIDQHISKTQISQEISSNKNGESFHLKKVKSKRKDKTKQQAVDKSEDVETLDVSKHYILKGKDFDHHYTLYYDEETAVNGDGSPGQTPPTKYKNSDNSLHSCSKKEIYRHYLKTRPANDVFRKRYKQHKSQLHFTNSNSEEHALAYRKDFPDKNLKHERSENVLQSYRQKVLPAYSDAIPLRENVLLSSCNAADTSCWSNIRPISRQCCSLEESSSPHPLLSSSFLHQSNLSKIESDRKSQDLKDSVTCDIDGQKHSTGIPVMPIILPVVGYRDGQRNTLFNFWPSYMSRTQASSGSNGHNKSDEGTPAEDALKESESEETSVKQDSTSSQLVATSACEESNSYKPRRSHLLTLSVREVKEETLPAGAVEQEDIPEQHNLTSKQDMAAKNDNLTEQSVVQFSGNLTSPNVNNKTALVATKGSASLSHGNTKEAQVSKDDLNDVESGKNDHRARFTSAFPKMYSNQSHQDKPMPVNTKQFILRTSSPCELATNPSLNQFAICNENPLLDSALFSSQYPCKNLEPSARIKPEKRSKNKVMVNIGSNDGLTTLIDHSLATHEPQARSGKHEHRYHLEGVVMRSDHKSRHARPSTAEMFRGGFNHNIPPQPYLMNRPISHPHVDSTLHHGSAIKHGTKHWSVHADLPRTSPNHLVSHKSSKTLKNDLSFRNSFFGDPKRNSPSSQSSYSVQSEGSQKTNLSKSPNHTAGEVTQVNVHATPDLLPPDSHLKDEPCCKLKDKSTKQSQSLFTRLTQSSLSFFSRDPKPNNAPK